MSIESIGRISKVATVKILRDDRECLQVALVLAMMSRVVSREAEGAEDFISTGHRVYDPHL